MIKFEERISLLRYNDTSNWMMQETWLSLHQTSLFGGIEGKREEPERKVPGLDCGSGLLEWNTGLAWVVSWKMDNTIRWINHYDLFCQHLSTG